jgi:hypothetical protein
MKVASVDEGDLRRGLAKCLRRPQTAKPAADDHNAMMQTVMLFGMIWVGGLHFPWSFAHSLTAARKLNRNVKSIVPHRCSPPSYPTGGHPMRLSHPNGSNVLQDVLRCRGTCEMMDWHYTTFDRHLQSAVLATARSIVLFGERLIFCFRRERQRQQPNREYAAHGNAGPPKRFLGMGKNDACELP